MDSNPSEPSPVAAPKADWLEIVRKNVMNLRFGSVQITVHDGRVTQIESIEKTRFVAPRDDGPTGRK
jgi:hypothetical protein